MTARIRHTAGKDVITLQPAIDAATGLVVYEAPRLAAPQLPTIDAGRVNVDQVGNQVQLTDERFAADSNIDWSRAEQAQAAGQTVQIIDGQLVANDKSTAPGQSVTLTDERFAVSTHETAEVLRLVRSGTVAALISDLRPTAELRQHLPTDPGGWYLRTKPTPTFGDVLHTVIVRRSATGLYHAHLWRFMQNDRGQLKIVDLNRWVGTHASLSAHHTHLYPGQRGDSAVLCLSQRTTGGMPHLTGTVLQAAKWADGMGHVVRGGSFPYRQ